MGLMMRSDGVEGGGCCTSIRRTGGLVAILLQVALLQSACGSPSDCDPDQEDPCSPESSCAASDDCSSDARTPTNSSSSGSGGRGMDQPSLPTQCTSDNDCPADSKCFTNETEDGADHPPQPGMCVADCAADTRDCSSFSNAVCVDTFTTTAYCIHSCEVGTTDVSKCGTREDSACHPLETGIGYCSAICTSHDQCEGACSARTGQCTSGSAPVFEDFGSECDPDSPESCSGTCVEVEPGYAVCSNPCVFGSAAPCALDASAPSLCAIVTAGGSIGDLGYCTELCDCNQECTHPNAVCDPFTDADVVELLGYQGVCAASRTADGTSRSGVDCD